ncbi:MAG: histidine kinase N-terminal 7TM domain-containing protein [Anaerolineae bacterium]|nr:MAG: histidine kinase N-terminal 7TM domain-containing protein [Anaerolineae bacterium]
MSEQFPLTLALINDILQAIIVIFSTSVLLYNLRYLFRDRVTRAFNAMIFFVIIVYFTELLATRTTLADSAEVWIRIGWIGIALVPAAQFHLADALLETTGEPSRNRKILSRVWYLVGILFFSLAIFTELLITDPNLSTSTPHMGAGPLFPLFAAYYWIISGASVFFVGRARALCVTKTTRKRLTMILIAILAAPLAVFPYLTISRGANVQSSVLFWLIIILGNLIISVMFALLTYYMAYFGAISPDRVVRVRLFKYMARIPLAASIVLLVYVALVQSEQLVGLHLETALAIALVATVILVEWAIYAFKRPLERLFQLTDEPEVRRIQQLSERVLTTRDLRQFLESVLAAACEVLRTPSAFAASISADGPKLEAVIGFVYAENDQWLSEEWQDLAQSASTAKDDHTDLPTSGRFILWGNFWIRPLYTEQNDILVGILGVEARSEKPDLNDTEEKTFNRLVAQATVALQDRLLQQEVFSAVEGLLPQVTAIQRTRSAATFGGTRILTSSALEHGGVIADPEFNSIVWDALSHYWGGPKLTQSPLMRLKVVQESVRGHGGNQTKALREILVRAVEQQRPEGERNMTTAEWILYNILELKFIQGQKVRDVARRLAMSESDLYRKQRVAIENVASAISEMESAVLIEDETHTGSEPELRVIEPVVSHTEEL